MTVILSLDKTEPIYNIYFESPGVWDGNGKGDDADNDAHYANMDKREFAFDILLDVDIRFWVILHTINNRMMEPAPG